jgi:hypothetical protein
MHSHTTALDIVLTLELNLCDRVTEHLNKTALVIVLTLELTCVTV